MRYLVTVVGVERGREGVTSEMRREKPKKGLGEEINGNDSRVVRT